jgi:hypothetical protein
VAALALFALLGSACASSRMGQAEVRLHDGQPCFAVAAAEWARTPELALQALLLSDLAAQPPAVRWALLVPAGQADPALQPVACITWGQAPVGLAVTTAAQAPVAGHVYEVFINARPPQGRAATRGYSARFCLRGGPPGPWVLHPLADNAGHCPP